MTQDAGLNKAIYSTVSVTTEFNTIIYRAGATRAGNLGNRAAVDAECAASANKPSGYTYKAFISYSAADDIETTIGAVVNQSSSIGTASGVVLANNWADLLDGLIKNSLDAAGLAVGTDRWFSGSNSDGTSNGKNCNSWTSSASSGNPLTYGLGNVVTTAWIDDEGTEDDCATPAHLLCIAYKVTTQPA